MAKQYLGGGISFEQKDVYQEFSGEMQPKLDDMSDVEITEPAAGEYLAYDADIKKWVNAPAQLPIKVGTVTISSVWSESAPYFTQTVEITGADVTAHSMIELLPTPEQIVTLQEAGITAVIVDVDSSDESPVVRVTAVGGYTPASMTVTCTVTEVTVEEESA